MSTTDELIAAMESMSEPLQELREMRGMLAKPLLGGIFGPSGFQLASFCFQTSGLHEVRFYVFSDTWLFFGTGETRGEAIAMARLVSQKLGRRLSTLLAEHRAKKLAAEVAERKRIDAIQIAMDSQRSPRKERVGSISRRRRQIFAESDGKCHYCETALTLDGKWHIEHKHPKALGGGNEPGNLVASCVPCNMKKRDTTDLEFKARLAKGGA